MIVEPHLTDAATWHERLLDAPKRGATAAFEAWRGANPSHAEAYDAVQAARARAASVAADPGLLALRHETVARATFDRHRSRFGRRTIAAGALFCAGAPLAAWGINQLAPPPAQRPIGETFHTDIGQRADVTLPDGSIVTLDTNSKLKVLFAGSARRVALRGQGWFHLAPAATPFVIEAGNAVMSAGTGIFDLRTDPGLVRAFAVDGTISVKPATDAAAAAVAVTPGHLFAARGSDATVARPANPLSFTGWHGGMLQFDDVPLMVAASELNRYRRRPIRIADARAANLRISGAFRPAETSAFTDALAAGFPVRVRQDDNAGVIVADR